MNNFQILSKLGEGAYSVVYKVKRLIDNNIYALKKVKLLNLSDKEKSNALNEVRILASLNSSYVIMYKEAFFDENEKCLGIVMEYADKGDLYQKICEFKKGKVYFEESDIFRILLQIVRGLKALHDLKILHRDLKASSYIYLFISLERQRLSFQRWIRKARRLKCFKSRSKRVGLHSNRDSLLREVTFLNYKALKSGKTSLTTLSQTSGRLVAFYTK